MSTDLSHWDLVDEFTARETACLIFGMDPNDPRAPTWKVEPLLRRMRESYSRTVAGVVIELTRDPHNPDDLKPSNFMELMGRGLTFFYLRTERQADELWPVEDAIARLEGSFEQERFSRPEISRWLSLFRIESKYRFDRSAGPEPSHSEETAAVHIPKMRLQEDWIIEKVRELGHEPDQLPPATSKGGVKAAVKEHALKYRQRDGKPLFTQSAFSAAWDRLRKEGRIAGGHLKSS